MRPSKSYLSIRVTCSSIFIIILLFSFTEFGCRNRSTPGTSGALTEIKVGYQPFTSDLAIFIAIEKGYFKENGISPRLVMFRSTTDFLNALVAERIDVAGIIGAPTLFARESESSGLVKVFLPTIETEQRYVAAFLVPKDSPIHSIAELKGKTVGTYSGTTQALNLKYILSKFFDPEKEVKTVQVSSELQLQALASGQFDALLTIEPYSTLGITKGIARVLEENPRCKYIMSPFPAAAQAVSVEYLKNYPEVFKGYYAAIRKAVEFIKNNPTESKSFLPKYTELTEQEAKHSNMYEWQYDENVDKLQFQKLADIYVKSGVLQKQIDVSSMFVPLESLGVKIK